MLKKWSGARIGLKMSESQCPKKTFRVTSAWRTVVLDIVRSKKKVLLTGTKYNEMRRGSGLLHRAV